MVREVRRIHRELTADERERIELARAQIAEELPDLIERNRLRKAAQDEESFSGELRRMIHKSDLLLPEIARQATIDLIELDEFLTAERTLPSDTIDRLVEVLGGKLVGVEQRS